MLQGKPKKRVPKKEGKRQGEDWGGGGVSGAKLTWKRKRKIYDFNLYCQVS